MINKIRCIFLIGILFTLSSPLQAQDIEEGVGPSKFASYLSKGFILSAGPSAIQVHNTRYAFGLNIFPRLSLIHSLSDFSISVGLPSSACFEMNRSVFFAQIPLLFELNIGHGATKGFYSRGGISIGAGYTNFFDDGLNFSATSVGFAYNRWILKQSVSFRYLVSFPTLSKAIAIHSLSINVSMGKWLKQNKRLNNLSKFQKPFRKR